MPLAPLHLDTPLVQTAPDYSASGKRLWLKLDALQPSGSFKLRGVGRLCQHAVENGAREIFCASGGNAGIVEGLKRNGLADVPVIAVETEGAASLNASLKANERITLPAITSIATSLGARQVAQHVFDLPKQHPIESVLVSDADAVAACLKFADAQRILVEPACGAALAVADVHAELFARFDNPLIEVCGGIGVSLEKLRLWKEKFL